MSQDKVLETLTPVRFYTSLDPYYYIVDNRPLEDLNKNIKLVAESSDAASGGTSRASLAAASVAYSMLGFGKVVPGEDYFVGKGVYTGDIKISGMSISFNHGFAVVKTDGGSIDGVQYDLPEIAVHDTISVKAMSPGVNGQTYLVQGKWRKSTDADRVGSTTSSVMVLEISHKSGLLGVPPILDMGAIAIMRVDVPAGTAEITKSNITYLNMKDIAQVSDPLGSADIYFNTYSTILPKGTSTFSLNGTDIDPAKMSSVEIFVQGVNQFNWTYNASTNSISLAAAITRASAEINVRQTTVKLA